VSLLRYACLTDVGY